MSASPPPVTRWSGRVYLRFLAAVAAAVAILMAIGFAVSGATAESARAVVAALGAIGVASALSGIPLALTGGPPHAAINRSLVAMLIRLALVGLLATLCLVGLGVAQRPFLLWLVIGYLALLAVDTVFSVRAFRSL